MESNDDGENVGYCTDLLTSYKVSDLFGGATGSVGVGSLIVAVCYICNTLLTLYWISTQKKNVENNIDGAVQYIMFPLYIPFMWASAISDLIVGIIVVFISYDSYESNSWPVTISYSTMWCVQHWVIEGIACLLLQYGCGIQAVRNAFIGSTAWALFTFICYIFATRHGGHVSIIITFLWHFVILCFYLTLWIAPDEVYFRRTALKKYSRFWAIFRFVSIIGLLLWVFQNGDLVDDDAADCYYVVGVILSYIIFKPYVVYYALLMDSVWWQGVMVTDPSKCKTLQCYLDFY